MALSVSLREDDEVEGVLSVVAIAVEAQDRLLCC
jgi:hypothetical protein